MKISIIGSGFVGTAIGRGLIELSNEVIFYDIVHKDPPNFTFTMDINHAIESTNISFICVPTPTTPEGIDMSYIKEATKNIGKVLANKEGYHLVVVKSTVVSGTTENVVIPILEEYSGKKAGSEIGACMNPEFLTEISGTWSKDEGTRKDFFTEDRIVIGEYDKKSGDFLEELSCVFG